MSGITLGNLEVDRDRFEVRIDGRRVELTYKEYELLAALAAHAGRVVSPEQLALEAWGEQVEAGFGKLRVHISRLRKKIGLSRPWNLVTVKKRGYLLSDEPPNRVPAGPPVPASGSGDTEGSYNGNMAITER